MRKLVRILFLHLAIAAPFAAAHAELARIGMVHFTGNVESAGYLGTSLASAIDDSLKKKFSYQRIPEEKIKSVLDDLSKVGIFDPRKIPEKNNLLRIAVALDADILIYGSYGIIAPPAVPGGQKPVDKDATQQISMKTYVYYVNENRTAELPELKPLLDGSIFEAINTSAENVVAEFKKITVETESDDEIGSIQTAATLRMAWLPVAAADGGKNAASLYTAVAQAVHEERDAIQISNSSVADYAQKTQWSQTIAASLKENPQYLADAAIALKSDLVFWAHTETENRKKYLVVSAYHAQLKKILFSIREEAAGKTLIRAAKIQSEILEILNNLEFSVTAQIAGLKGQGLVLEFGHAEFKILPTEAQKSFGKLFKSGETFTLTVKQHPREPRQFCHVRDGKGAVTHKNIEILITCITETVPLVVKTVSFFGGELLLSLDGREEIRVTGTGEQQFQSRVEDLQVFDLSIQGLPKRPAQTCRLSPPSKLAEAKVIEVTASCQMAVEHQLSAYLGYPFMTSLGASSDIIQVGQNFPVGKMSSFYAVGIAYQVKNLLPYNLLLGTQANFSTASVTLPVQMFAGETSTGTIQTNMLRADLSAFTAYPFPLPWRLELLPYAGFGFSYQNIWRSGGATLSSGITPFASLGAILQYDFKPQIKLLFKTGPDLYFYKNGENLMIWSFSFGVGKQFL